MEFNNQSLIKCQIHKQTSNDLFTEIILPVVITSIAAVIVILVVALKYRRRDRGKQEFDCFEEKQNPTYSSSFQHTRSFSDEFLTASYYTCHIYDLSLLK